MCQAALRDECHLMADIRAVAEQQFQCERVEVALCQTCSNTSGNDITKQLTRFPALIKTLAEIASFDLRADAAF